MSIEQIKKAVRKLGDPWEGWKNRPRTRLFDDGTFVGDGEDLIACRDIVHDLYELWFGDGGAK